MMLTIILWILGYIIVALAWFVMRTGGLDEHSKYDPGPLEFFTIYLPVTITALIMLNFLDYDPPIFNNDPAN